MYKSMQLVCRSVALVDEAGKNLSEVEDVEVAERRWPGLYGVYGPKLNGIC